MQMMAFEQRHEKRHAKPWTRRRTRRRRKKENLGTTKASYRVCSLLYCICQSGLSSQMGLSMCRAFWVLAVVVAGFSAAGSSLSDFSLGYLCQSGTHG
ncbi:hypothetical protein Mapa_005200 [Marchantia paleacea]|nr:hypothetical protein Mapa_005200 [Marchantia paleacea]